MSSNQRQRRTQAPGQYLGFSLQHTRFLQLLLKAQPGTTVSLEVFEDVGVELPDASQIATQVKSALATNPIADRAPELWKAIRNWRDAADNKLLDPTTTTFEIYVGSVKSGAIVQDFDAAQALDQARESLQRARVALWGVPPDYPQKQSLPKELREHCDIVLNPADEIVPVIVAHFRLECGSGDPIADAKQLMQSPLVPTEVAELAFPHALGWIKIQLDQLLQRQAPAVIQYDAFAGEMRAFVRKVDQGRILTSHAPRPSKAALEANRVRTYVTQLDFIEAQEDDKIQAINDCLRAEIDRTHWSTQGIIHESSLDELKDALCNYWRNKKAKNSTIHRSLNPIDQGNVLYRDCMMHRLPLEGLEVPTHFTPGSFHTLADEEEVGWHHDFKSLLATRRQGGQS